MKDFIIRDYTIASSKIQGAEEVRAVMLCDLHNHAHGAGNCNLVKAIETYQPDFILSAGDLITAKEESSMDQAEELLRQLSCRYPVYCVNGNHETRLRTKTDELQYEKYCAYLRGLGITLLNNKSADAAYKGSSFRISGYEMDMHYYHKWNRYPLSKEDIDAILGTADQEHFQILLAHNPVYFDQYAAWGSDLTLSGHLHGGIIRLPFIGGLITPQAKLFPKYDRGLFDLQGHKLVVGSGLGEHTVKIRWNNPRELICLRLRRED